ncbi:MAG: DUF3644 domain-containing protein [Verrucomicrobia bacterium]|nr:DUF3644 domain-containing protein [Verrucomicrobiota bacterium]
MRLYAFQAKWMKLGGNYHVILSEKPLRYKYINGERMSQPLEWFVREEFSSPQSAVRANIEFFIRLRNKIEHRHTGSDEALLTIVSGECHSMLLNYEEFITSFGGSENSLGKNLHFPVFIGGFTDQGKQDLLRMTKSLPADLRTFLTEYDAGLDDTVSRDPRYCMRLTIILESGNRKGDLSLQFVNDKDLTDEQRIVAEEIAANKGYVITKHRTVPVSNANNLKPRQVARAVEAEIPFVFNSNTLASVWRKQGWRPVRGSASPEITRSEFCVYDMPHNDYTYTPAAVKWLIKRCGTADGFAEVTGLEAKLKKTDTLPSNGEEANLAGTDSPASES